ncbi:ABC transporter ATP-binding protein [Paracoccus sp. (in: a-proteobacteria)]|uniref:ABC transporter ATP-binding protein n=1 Tax=Paracoccus sp. TaxID=267 RepID=UPI0028ABCE06|nr:ABC transporter ATP-binding protein [Paracoccus sp. (in: a-proteobacteria)]
MSDNFALVVENLSLRFGGLQVLHDVTLPFAAGEITGLIGPNGAGKTSFFNCLTGHYKPSEGTVRLAGETINVRSITQRAAMGIARTFQHAALSPELNLVENVVVGLNTIRRSGWLDALLPLPGSLSDRKEALEQAFAALDAVGLADKADQLASIAAPGVMRLTELARAAASGPKVVLLDEPAAGLNSGETAELARMIAALRSADRVIVVVEHDMDLIMSVCDRIHVLNFGHVVTSGTPSEIQADPRVAEIYLGASDE